MRLDVTTRRPPANPHATPLLFVHGAWHAAWCWDEYFLPYFARHGYNANALSLRGHGNSEGRDRLRWYSLADYVSDVAQVARELSQPPVVIGHSLGGLVVQKYLEMHQTPGAVLVASAPVSGLFGWLFRYARRHPGPCFKTGLTLTPYEMVGKPELARESFFSANLPEEEFHRYFARIQDESFRVSLDGLFSPSRPDRVKTPILLVAAANDQIFTVHEEEATARAYNAEYELFPNMAHDMMVEPGWQAVADRILAWLDKCRL